MKQAAPALLIIDIFIRFDFPEASQVKPAALQAAPQIAKPAQHSRERGHPVIYANDNFANWQMDFKDLVNVPEHRRCLIGHRKHPEARSR